MAGPDKPQELEATLAQLRLAYRRSLAGKRRVLEAHWCAVKQNPEDNLAWRAMQKSVHQLAGSAGSYGFVALGEAAQSLDACIGSFLHDTGLNPHEGVAQHGAQVEKLDCLLREAEGTAPS